MPAAQIARGVRLERSGQRRPRQKVAGQDQPIGGRKTAEENSLTICGRRAIAGLVAKRCCAANGTAWVNAIPAKAHAQAQPFLVQSQSPWSPDCLPRVAGASLQSSSAAEAVASWSEWEAAGEAFATWPAIPAAIAVARHTPTPPSRQSARMSKQRSRSAKRNTRGDGLPSCLYHQISRAEMGCQPP